MLTSVQHIPQTLWITIFSLSRYTMIIFGKIANFLHVFISIPILPHENNCLVGTCKMLPTHFSSAVTTWSSCNILGCGWSTCNESILNFRNNMTLPKLHMYFCFYDTSTIQGLRSCQYIKSAEKKWPDVDAAVK